MGVNLFVGEEQIGLCSAVFFDEYLNEVAEYGDYPNILTRSWNEGKISVKYEKKEPDLFDSSVIELIGECKDLLKNHGLSERAKVLTQRILVACNMAVKLNKDIELS